MKYLASQLCAIYFSVASAQQVITADVFAAGIENGEYDAVLDVRTSLEWNAGHIANTTLIENLASDGTPDDILGCSTCTIAIYCRTGNRAGQAITRLQNEYNFTGTLYNAQGTSQWTNAGYPLVTTGESEVPPCALSDCESCTAECPTDAPGDGGGDSGNHVSVAASVALAMIGLFML